MFKENLYSLDEHEYAESDFLKGQLIKVSDYHPNSYRLSGLKDWVGFLGLESIEMGVTTVENKDGTGGERLTDFKHSGIAYEFSKLKTNNDIHEFSGKYGLLGIKTPSSKQAETNEKLRELYKSDQAMQRIFNTAFLELTAGNSYFEPIEVWKYYVDQVRKILKLYKALVNIHSGNEITEIEYKLLNIGDELKTKSRVSYVIEWWDGTPTGLAVPEETAIKGDFIEIARNVLIQSVNEKTSQHINSFAINIIETNKPPLGFVIQETRTTSFLLNAIFYDLWNLISKNEPVHICENPNCKLPFKKQKRQKYCSNACKQEAYRIRKAGTEKQ